jgi:hypothetical protein
MNRFRGSGAIAQSTAHRMMLASIDFPETLRYCDRAIWLAAVRGRRQS